MKGRGGAIALGVGLGIGCGLGFAATREGVPAGIVWPLLAVAFWLVWRAGRRGRLGLTSSTAVAVSSSEATATATANPVVNVHINHERPAIVAELVTDEDRSAETVASVGQGDRRAPLGAGGPPDLSVGSLPPGVAEILNATRADKVP